MYLNRSSKQLSLAFFLSVCLFSSSARAETFAGYPEIKVYSVPQIEVQTTDTPVPEVLLLQLEQEKKKTSFLNIFHGTQAKKTGEKPAPNLFTSVKLAKPSPSYKIGEEIAENR